MEVMCDYFELPEVAQKLATRGPCAPSVLANIPANSRKNVYIHPWHLDMSEDAKFGLQGKYPSTVAIRSHFSSIIHKGYESERESLEVKFPSDMVNGQPLGIFSVQYIDGHAKAIMILSVFALLDHLVACPNLLMLLFYYLVSMLDNNFSCVVD